MNPPEELVPDTSRIEEIFLHHPDSIFVLEVTPDGRFLLESYNRAALATTGLTIEAARGRESHEFLPRQIADAVTANYRRCVEAEATIEYEETLDFGAGPRVFHTKLVPIRDETGRICRLAGFARDVSKRHQAESALRESQRVLSTLLGNLPGMAYRCANDREWTMEFVSEGCRALTGYAPSDFLQSRAINFAAIIHPEDREKVWEQVQAAVGERRSFDLVYRITHRDGATRSVSERGTGVYDAAGKLVALEGFIADATDRWRAEQALRESEERFSKAFRASPDAISVSDMATGRFIDVNEGFERLFAVKRDEVIGRTSLELGLWANTEDRLRMVEELRTRGAVRDFRSLGRTRDGRMRMCQLSAETVEIGGQKCFVLVTRDITEQVEAERALRESEEKFATAFRCSPHVMSITDLETGRYIEVNEAHEKFFGLSREEAIGRTPLELGLLAVPEQYDEFADRLRREGKVRDFEVRAIGRKRGEILALLSGDIIQFGGRACVLRVSHDITAQKRAEAALRESEEKFAKAFRASPYSVTISDVATGEFLDVNHGFELLSGYTREEALGRTTAELGIWDDPSEREDYIQRLRETGSIRGFEVHFRDRNKRLILTRNSSELIEIRGRQCVVSTSEDLTPQREMEEAKARIEEQLRQAQKLEALGTLAGGIAHDFNNILTAIFAYLDLALLDAGQPESLHAHIDEVRRAAERARDLVSQILAFSRQQKHVRKPTQLHRVVREALRLLRSTLPATIEIESRIDPSCPPVLADPSQIHQVVMNLCTNAAHAMRERPGKLSVALERVVVDETLAVRVPELTTGDHVRLIVADNGHGMSEETLKRIYEPFFTTKLPGEGTGLGLPVVHGIVHDYEGAIDVESRLNVGTTFTVYFPAHHARVADVDGAAAEIASGAGERILVVDDERPICVSLQSILGRLGYKAVAMTDPRMAVVRIAAAPGEFDLVITDLTMPGMTGIDLARQLLAIRADMPVIVMSGFSATWTPDKVRALGIRDLIAKPVSLAALSTALRHAFTPIPNEAPAP